MPIGKKKTALIDANRKKENSFNRCQSEKTNFKKISFQTKLNNQKIWISKRRYWLYSKNSQLDIFSTSPISNKMWATLFFREHFSFSTHILPKSRTRFVFSCSQSRLDIRNLKTEGVNTASQIKTYNKKL